MTEKLFSYGTLQQEDVQLATFGRKLKGTKDILGGYCLEMVKINDPKVVAASGKEFHPILTISKNNSDKVEGTVFDITKEELNQADKYEVKEYKRVEVKMLSGRIAWVYVKADS